MYELARFCDRSSVTVTFVFWGSVHVDWVQLGTAPSVLVRLNRHLILQKQILQGLWRLSSELVHFLSLPSLYPNVIWPGSCALSLQRAFPHCMAGAMGIREMEEPWSHISPFTDCIWGEGWQAESDQLAVFVLIPYPLEEFKFPVFLRCDLWRIVRQTCISYFPKHSNLTRTPVLGSWVAWLWARPGEGK